MNRARLGVDIGGTFTDVALEVGDALYTAKHLTTQAQPEQAIMSAIDDVTSRAGVPMGDVGLIVHGTTLATNALIERAGAHTALITTRGFRDVIEMRKENRFEQYDLNITLPPALIARNHRYVVDERISAQGEILKSLADADIATVCDAIADEGYESVAIGLIHAYVDARHERRLASALQERIPAIDISLSSAVSPQMREFERFNTVCANAYVRPRMRAYLERLTARLKQAGARCGLYIMHSGGGIMSVETASEFPVRLIESGPAGGAIFAADVAQKYALARALSFDMGGTTAKICLVDAGVARTARSFEVARTYRFKKGSGMPISIPVIDMVEIGAGGGSIAHIDEMQQIRVGPQSAGSEPGPACYQRGGRSPTVTDADLILGRLDPERFAGGAIALLPGAARDALNEAIGARLTTDTLTAALGVAEVVDENMANAARQHSVENGKDIAEYTMIAFGGAAPLHAGRLCQKLAIRQVLIPPGAGVGSAIGFLRAPFAFEASRSAYVRLDTFDATLVGTVMRELTDEATAFVRDCDPSSTLAVERWAFMRYVGQGWEIPVPVTDALLKSTDGDHWLTAFNETYAQLFGRPVAGLDVEAMSWSVNVSTASARVESAPARRGEQSPAERRRRKLYDHAIGDYVHVSEYERQALQHGYFANGPCVVVEDETTIIVPSGFSVHGQRDGCLLVAKEQVD